MTTSQATSAIAVTVTNSAGQQVTSVPALITTRITSSDSNGVVYTVTQIIRNPTGSLNDGSGTSGSGSTFFNNTGAVVGVFVVVGIAGAAILLGFGFLFVRRRRRQRLDRDVAAAAAAANAAAQRTPFEDDEDTSGANSSLTSGPAMTQYGGYYSSGAGPGGYDYEQAGGYDPYAVAAGAAVGGGAGVAAGGMAGARQSTSTVPGLAGVGGNDRFARSVGMDDPYVPHNQGGGGGEYYLDPNEYDYDNVGASAGGGGGGAAAAGGYGNAPYSDQPHVYAGMHTNGSEGSVGGDDDFNNRRGALKVSGWTGEMLVLHHWDRRVDVCWKYGRSPTHRMNKNVSTSCDYNQIPFSLSPPPPPFPKLSTCRAWNIMDYV